MNYREFSDEARMDASVMDLYKSTLTLEGDVAEFGVFRGRSSARFFEILPHSKTLHLCDSFEGMLEDSSNEEDPYMRVGDFFNTSVGLVESRLSEISTTKKYQIHKGWIPPIPESILEVEKFCFVYIDIDLYKAYKEVLNFVWPRLVDGGILYMDDIYHDSCPGATKAFKEFVKENHLKNVSGKFLKKGGH